MVYEVELVRGDTEFMSVQARNKHLSREHASMVGQLEQLKGLLGQKETKLSDMMRDLSAFDTIASRAQEARRHAEERQAHADAEAKRLQKAQENIDEHVNRLVSELRDKERKLQQFTGKGRSRSTSPVPDTADDATHPTQAVMGDASVPLDYSCAGARAGATLTHEQLQIEFARALAANNDLQLQLKQQYMCTQQAEIRWRSLEQQLEKQSADSTRLLQAAAEIGVSETLATDSIAAKYNAVAKLDKVEIRLAEKKLQLQQSLENNKALTSQLSQLQMHPQPAADEETRQLKIRLLQTEQQLTDAAVKLDANTLRNDITMEGFNEEVARSKQLTAQYVQLQTAHETLQQQYAMAQQELNEAKRHVESEKHRAMQMDAAVQLKIDACEAEKLEARALQQQIDEARRVHRELQTANLDMSQTIQHMRHAEIDSAGVQGESPEYTAPEEGARLALVL